ncbi:hypothetical protein DFJ74DRAFT_649840 [Hyaloraphidium curvatum]|nr:hypothetical protein DFJ74DRAFT_649840 [Hyaloraphidium curvatum]
MTKSPVDIPHNAPPRALDGLLDHVKHAHHPVAVPDKHPPALAEHDAHAHRHPCQPPAPQLLPAQRIVLLDVDLPPPPRLGPLPRDPQPPPRALGHGRDVQPVHAVVARGGVGEHDRPAHVGPARVAPKVPREHAVPRRLAVKVRFPRPRRVAGRREADMLREHGRHLLPRPAAPQRVLLERLGRPDGDGHLALPRLQAPPLDVVPQRREEVLGPHGDALWHLLPAVRVHLAHALARAHVPLPEDAVVAGAPEEVAPRGEVDAGARGVNPPRAGGVREVPLHHAVERVVGHQPAAGEVARGGLGARDEVRRAGLRGGAFRWGAVRGGVGGVDGAHAVRAAPAAGDQGRDPRADLGFGFGRGRVRIHVERRAVHRGAGGNGGARVEDHGLDLRR